MYHWHHRGPSRFVWFMIGAFSATWFLKHKHQYHIRPRCSRPDLPADSYSQQPQYYPPSIPIPAPPPAPAPAISHALPVNASLSQAHEQSARVPESDREKVHQAREWGWGWGSHGSTPSPPTPPVDHGWDEESQKRWAEERQQKRQVTDTFADFSEATLDTVMSAVESLKSKLAEHRANRDRQIREWQAWREQQIKQLEEWKKQQAEMQGRQTPPPSSPYSV